MKKFELTEDELKDLMYKATESWNMNVFEKQSVSMEVGIKMYIHRLINEFKQKQK